MKGGYFLYKLGIYVATFFLAITVNFILPRLMPGSALATIISLLTSSNGVSVTGAGGSVFISMEIKQIEAAFGLTPAPWYVQYGRYLEGIFTGNLGVSITYYPEAVAKIISSGLPWTVGLVAVSAVIAFFIGSYLGEYRGFREEELEGHPDRNDHIDFGRSPSVRDNHVHGDVLLSGPRLAQHKFPL
jgi:ABC-type dipeptide/oligopeptide/nickel transport systems, permease components